MTHSREQKLLYRIKRRQDRKAAEELIREYYREIYGYVFRQLCDKERAMDTTQEIFLSVLQSLWSYDPAKSSFRTWLYKIATNKVTDHIRSRYRREKFQAPSKEDPALSSDYDMEISVMNREAVREIFRFLSGKNRDLEEIFRLKFYGGYTFRQIGEAMALKESTVKSKYYGAVKEIQNKFKVQRCDVKR